jgi:hypothetical protein
VIAFAKMGGRIYIQEQLCKEEDDDDAITKVKKSIKKIEVHRIAPKVLPGIL